MANNTSANGDDWLSSHQTRHDAVLAGAIAVSVPITIFNLFSIYVLLISRRLRKARNFPIASFLAASALQSLFVLPIYMQKTLDDDPTNKHEWICDLYRFPYFFTQHFIKVGLLVTSVDRIIAIRHPYKYATMVSKFMMMVTLSILFLFTLIMDLIPFFVEFGKKIENCAYLPTQEWGLSVIIIFDMLPFFVIVANYIAIWRIAASISKNIRTQKRVTGAAEDSNMGKYSLQNKESIDHELQEHPSPMSPEKQMSFSVDNLNELNGDAYNNGLNCANSSNSINSLSSSTKSNNNTNRIHRTRNGISFKLAWEMKATRTSIIGGVVYAVCWMPMGVFYIIDHMCDGCLSGERTNTMRYTKVVIKFICLTSSIFLPFVFCWRTKEFRNEVMRIYCKKLHKKNAMKSVGLTTVTGAISAHNNAAIITNRNAML